MLKGRYRYFTAALLVGIISLPFIGPLLRLVGFVSNQNEQARIRFVHHLVSEYHKENGGYPFRSNTKPQVSWRVHVLRYANGDRDLQEAIREYDFNQRWDAEQNINIIETVKGVYSLRDTGNNTNFLGVINLDESGREVVQKSLISYPELLVVPESSVPWTKPKDAVFKQDSFFWTSGIKPESRIKLNGCTIVWTNGEIQRIPFDASEEHVSSVIARIKSVNNSQ